MIFVKFVCKVIVNGPEIEKGELWEAYEVMVI